MYRQKNGAHSSVVPAGTLVGLLLLGSCAAPAPEPEAEATDAVAFEGARVIVGNGDVIENGTFVVEDDRLTAVGDSAAIEVPAGATRVDLAGRTVMPAIIDTHVHLRSTREELVEDLQRKAYYGVAAVMSLGWVSATWRTRCATRSSRTRPDIGPPTAASRHRNQVAATSLTGSRPRKKPARRCRKWRRRTLSLSRSGLTTATGNSRS